MTNNNATQKSRRRDALLNAGAYRLGYKTFRIFSSAVLQAVMPNNHDGTTETNAAIHQRLSELLAGAQESLDQFKDGRATDIAIALKKYPRKNRAAPM